MKLVKLSLVAALAAGAFSAANATPLEEAIKDIDVSGLLRYRYDTGRVSDGFPVGSVNTKKQIHRYKAQLNLSSAIADNFKAFVQFNYNSDDGGYGVGSKADTSSTLTVRQLYLTYTDENTGTNVLLGKQRLNTIWTDNGIDGLVGTAVKVVNTSVDGLTLAAFVVDSINADDDGDVKGFLNGTENIYGVAAQGSYDVAGGQYNPQVWLAYMTDNAVFYALDASYSTTIFDGIGWTLEGAYLGNSLQNELKDAQKQTKTRVGNGNFFALRGSVTLNNWDASLGGLYYGQKKRATVTVIEDQGNLGSLLAGQEIFNTDGSVLNGDQGRNIFGYVTLGYTFDETVRVGGDFVYGGTETGTASGQSIGGGKKLEAVARVDYKYTPKISFSTFYSYVNVDDNKETYDHNTVRLQALYKF